MQEPAVRILLVEDEEAHAELIRRAFDTSRNYRLTVAGSLREATAMMAETPPDIIVADLLLPDGKGTQLLPADPDALIPLVVLTAHGDEQAAVEAMKAGALDYVVKSPNILRDIPRVAERALREWRHITERQRAEEERRKLEMRLQQSQRLESLGILAGGIAHDFNNLVMAIMGHARLALAGLDDSSSVRECIADIETAAVHASELCQQLLAYSGRHRFVVEAIDLNRLVAEMIQLLEAAISKRAILELDLRGDSPAIEGAAVQIRQIVMNLIMNASDALGGKKGRITVSTGTVMVGGDHVVKTPLNEELPAGKYVYVEVSDNGCGMDAATQKQIFDPFFTTKTSGRGLGMAAVKDILRSHPGALERESEVGVGTCFRILFPASDLPLPNAEDAGEPAAGRPRKPAQRLGGASTILLVEDDVTIRAVTTIALEGAGYLVLQAENGREALAQYRLHQEELAAILLDINMPELSGDETYRELRELGSEVPVIVSSGSAPEEVAELVPEHAGFIQKPYKAEALIAKVREVLLQG